MNAFVYVIHEEGKDGPIKIGIANNPALRLSGLQTGNFRRLIVAHLHKCESKECAKLVERAAHGALDDKRISGEWFDVTTKAAVEIISRGAAQDMSDERINAVLQKYLKEKKLTDEAFGKLIGVSTTAVFRYRKFFRTPRPAVMRRILDVTGGAIMPVDFYPSAESDAA